MSRAIRRLNRAVVKAINEPGRYNDGNGLYLIVKKSGSKSWLYRYRLNGGRRDMGLGSVSLTNNIDVVRKKADEVRALVQAGIDPLERRETDVERRIQEIEKQYTFAEIIDLFFKSKDSTGYFRTQQTRRRWYFCLTTHAKGLHKTQLSKITTKQVYKILEPLWMVKTETASRTRLYIEAVLAWAIAMEYRDGPNPAIWRGNLNQLLTPKERVKPSRNHPALPWQEIPTLMKKLRGLETPASYLLEFIILTASRSGEARGAVWDEVDTDKRLWEIPAERMKMKRPHIVPLEGASLSLVRDAKLYPHPSLVFHNPRNNKAFSYNAPMVTLRKLGYENITTHGFRSSFKTWALEATSFPTQAIEFALAHETKNTVERAYIRGNRMLDKRREVMLAWDNYCSGGSKA
ncbi:tyrosine-type recombinase/integrase [Fretibacter rubidus]|uniref:tyrosine-type recombinase/integrase n=1 Tax=Fretibacter rubidus TaxID=570162 RepID=UPI00352B2786